MAVNSPVQTKDIGVKLESMNVKGNVLQEWAKTLRIESLRMIHKSPAGHPGGALSVAEIIATLYFSEVNVKPDDPNWPGRDRVILSKGHACAALYAALGHRGYFDTEEFSRFRRINGLLEGHPGPSTPGIDAPSGSLGLGLSQGLGMAVSCRYTTRNFRVYVVLGDGDMQEGATWEALMAAAHHKADNLCAILDYNKVQQEALVKDTMDTAPIADKIKAFGWAVDEVDGHDTDAICDALSNARSRKGQPSFIIALTTKGKGVSFMEHSPQWHGTVPISTEQLDKALAEIHAM